MTPTDNRELLRQLKALQAENEKLKARGKTTIGGMKVSPKGCVSLYGLGRFPATHYAEHWMTILDKKEDIILFIRDHADQLSWKDDGAKEKFLEQFAASPTPPTHASDVVDVEEEVAEAG